MDTISIIWLVVLLGACAEVLILKDKQKKFATAALLVLMTIYVGSKFYQSIVVEKRASSATPSIDIDRAELMLRVVTAIESFKSTASNSLKSVSGGVPGAASAVSPQGPDIYSEPEHLLKTTAESSPEVPSAWAKLALVQHTRKADTSSSLEHLAKIKTQEGIDLEKAMRAILKGPLLESQVPSVKAELEKELPAGWYRNSALEALYRRAGERKNLERLLSDAGASDAILAAKLLFLLIFGAISVLVGIAVIFVQLLFVARSPGRTPDDALVMAPVHSSALTIYGVFLGWLTVQSMVGSIAQSALKSLSPVLKLTAAMEPGSSKPLVIALMVGFLYLLTNGPGTLLAYIVALKPHKIAFLEGFRVRTRVPGRAGPLRLIIAGIATWFAAVPLVLVASLISSKLGSQGSSNPIIALIMEAARSGNVLSTIVFYLTLSVLAPLCEETLFRGFLYANLRRSMGVLPAMFFSAFLFAAFHLDIGAFIPLFTLGCVFALTFEKNKSIVPSMIAHGLWNGGTFTLLLLLFS